MKILVGIFLALMVFFLTSKLKINVIYLKKNKNSFKIEFHINLGLYVLGFVKVLGISLKEDGIHFLFFKFPYNKVKIDKDRMKILKNFSVRETLKSLNLKWDKVEFDLEIGTEDMMLTVFSVFFISTLFSTISARNSKQINRKKYHYKITPIYNQNRLSFKISSKVSVKVLNIVKTAFSIQKQKMRTYCQTKKIPIKI